MILDIEKKTQTAVQYEQQQVTFKTPIEVKFVWWSKDNQRIYYIYTERAEKALRLIEIYATTGTAREVLKEEGSTHVEANLIIMNQPNVRDLKSGKELIWFSQRDGWAHLYLYDLKNGKLKNQKTSGPGLSEGWNVWRKTYLQHIKDRFR